MAGKKISLKGILRKWVQSRVKRYGFKGCVIRLGDEIVRATKTKDDDRKWAEMKSFMNEHWK